MPDIEIKFKMTLELSETWANTLSTEELIDYVKSKLNESLGTKGEIKKLSIVDR
jgi:hypothetical protein